MRWAIFLDLEWVCHLLFHSTISPVDELRLCKVKFKQILNGFYRAILLQYLLDMASPHVASTKLRNLPIYVDYMAIKKEASL